MNRYCNLEKHGDELLRIQVFPNKFLKILPATTQGGRIFMEIITDFVAAKYYSSACRQIRIIIWVDGTPIKSHFGLDL